MKCLEFKMLYSSCALGEHRHEYGEIGSTNLASSIDNFSGKILALILYRFTECILDRWIVAVDEVAIDELNRKRGFTCITVRYLSSSKKW